MNIKHILLVPGVIALTLACLPVLPASAQTEPAPTVQPRQRENKLNLTDAQKTQMKQIREETKAAIENILTPEQKTQLQTMKQSGQKMRGGFKNLNLTDAQKEQMRAIKQSAKQKMQAILTPEQRQMMQQKRQGMQQRRQQMRQQGT
ncbi:MAG: hypothetical protein HC866_11815 [Leptolyngbyaceae cyanobacterium RU_5_1]|nr:hypothetical protein [Leptolyngbyaceae cyanobacterium RU_5_1]